MRALSRRSVKASAAAASSPSPTPRPPSRPASTERAGIRRRWFLSSAAVLAGAAAVRFAGRREGAEVGRDPVYARRSRGWGGSGPTSGGGAAADHRLVGPPADAPAGPGALAREPVQPVEEDTARFRRWNAFFRGPEGGREVAMVDLDAVDHNLTRVRARLGRGRHLRLVTKSLPNVDLVGYVLERNGTDRVMVFSEGMLVALLERFGLGIDVLMGRPLASRAVARIAARSDLPLERVRFLVDGPARQAELARVAAEIGRPLGVAIELDVGLRRGGVADREALVDLLARITGTPLRFGGYMGYDGHVPFAPPGFDADQEFARVHARYARLVDAGRRAFPALHQGGDLVYDSGGSRTYARYHDGLDSPVDDVSVGSALLYPGHFADLSDAGLRRATFLASPVLKVVAPARVPFAGAVLPALAEWDATWQVACFLQGGDFPGALAFPERLARNPLAPGPDRVRNLLPNQSQWLAERGALEEGDLVFFHPGEGDGIRWLAGLDVFKGGRHRGRWPGFQPGLTGPRAG